MHSPQLQTAKVLGPPDKTGCRSAAKAPILPHSPVTNSVDDSEEVSLIKSWVSLSGSWGDGILRKSPRTLPMQAPVKITSSFERNDSTMRRIALTHSIGFASSCETELPRPGLLRDGTHKGYFAQ